MGKLIFISFSLVLLCAIASQAEGSRLVCYFGSWSTYRWGNGKFDVEDIDPFLCTHVMFGFVGLSDEPGINVLDPYNELYDDYGKGAMIRFTNLKLQNPDLKTIVAIGGWNEGSLRYSTLLGTAANRAIFVENALAFVQKYNFDGLDLDWEYPAQRGGASEDVSTFTELIKALRERFDEHGLLLTAAVAATESSFTLSYDVPALAQYLDFINVMTYDMHGSWDSTTGHNAPLHMAAEEAGTDNEVFNVESSIKAWIAYGAPPEKLVMGVPLYGRTFYLSSSDCITPRCAVSGAGVAGTWTATAGFMGYNELCVLESTYTQYYDEEANVPYMVNGLSWITYDNVKSVQAKVDFVKSMNLGGAMVWSIETDDFLGICGNGVSPLLTTLKTGVFGEDSDSVVVETPEETPEESVEESESVEETPEESVEESESVEETPEESVEESETVEETPEESVDDSETSEDSVCTSAGYVRDPEDCQVFYVCVSLSTGSYQATKFTCSGTLLFDTRYNVCNHATSVDC